MSSDIRTQTIVGAIEAHELVLRVVQVGDEWEVWTHHGFVALDRKGEA